jgi:prepilin-type processing-associated H-X9-DG protein
MLCLGNDYLVEEDKIFACPSQVNKERGTSPGVSFGSIEFERGATTPTFGPPGRHSKVGYGLSDMPFERIETRALGNGTFLAGEHWPTATAKMPNMKVNSILDPSAMVAFGDYSAGNAYGGLSRKFSNAHGGWRHSCKKNVSFWDGHVEHYRVLTHMDGQDPFWKNQ